MIFSLLLAAGATAPDARPWVSSDMAAIVRLLDQPPAACRSGGVVTKGGRVVAAKFYDRLTGYARSAGTTGGLGKAVFRVTRSDDRPGGEVPGSLRWAVARAVAAEGGWIAFAPELRGRTITLAAPLRLGSNLTIDGGCAMPRLTGAGRGSVLYLRGSRNVVLARVRIEQSGSGSDGDCITVSHGADRVWLAFLHLRKCRDGLVDVTRDGVAGPMRVTVSNSRFSDHDKVMLVAGSALSPPCRLSGTPIELTLAYNAFYRTGQRHPRVSGDALVHLHDNVIAFSPRPRQGGGTGGAYGTLAVGGAVVTVERTLYAVPPGRKFRIAATTAGQPDEPRCQPGKLTTPPPPQVDERSFVRTVIEAIEVGFGRKAAT